MNARARCARPGRRSSPVNGRALDRDAGRTCTAAPGEPRGRRISWSRVARRRGDGVRVSRMHGRNGSRALGRLTPSAAAARLVLPRGDAPSPGGRRGRRRGSRSSSARRAGYPADAGAPYLVWARRGPRPTSVTMAVYGTGATGTACWATREHSLPPGPCAPAGEPAGALVEGGVERCGADGALRGAHQPPREQGRDEMHARQPLGRRLRMLGAVRKPVPVAVRLRPGALLPTDPPDHEQRSRSSREQQGSTRGSRPDSVALGGAGRQVPLPPAWQFSTTRTYSECVPRCAL